jgi:hypothetical protein
MSECKKCPVCSIDNINGVFYWSHGPGKADSARVAASPDAVHTRVCQYAKNSGCINTSGNINNNYAYPTELQKQGKADTVTLVTDGLGWKGVQNYDILAEEILKEHQTIQNLETSFEISSNSDVISEE